MHWRLKHTFNRCSVTSENSDPRYCEQTFLVACTRLYKPLCRSVRRSVRRSVGPSVRRSLFMTHATYGDWPCCTSKLKSTIWMATNTHPLIQNIIRNRKRLKYNVQQRDIISMDRKVIFLEVSAGCGSSSSIWNKGRRYLMLFRPGKSMFR